MKQALKITSITVIVFGSLLLLIGLLFHFMNWPDMFNGLMMGGILIVLGLVLAGINLVLK